jgi:hypothetical protein
VLVSAFTRREHVKPLIQAVGKKQVLSIGLKWSQKLAQDEVCLTRLIEATGRLIAVRLELKDQATHRLGLSARGLLHGFQEGQSNGHTASAAQ